jgi:BirA family biotin operon repressor/biotin-[acetyl-CoA-carboxylase] ligase
MHLDPSAVARGVRLDALHSVGSTNAEALARARAGESGNLWVTAEQQSAGRGRRGRHWHSPRGNLYASLLLTDASKPEHAPQLSFVAGLAVHDAVAALAPALESRLRLKWPNDLLLDDAKVAGILVEGEVLGDGRFAAVIGIGVNCLEHPEDAGYPATSLATAGVQATAAELLTALSRTMLARVEQWERGRGFAAIRSDWLAHAGALGQPILVRTPTELHGFFAGVDESGRLLLRDASGSMQVLAAGEISIPAGECAA